MTTGEILLSFIVAIVLIVIFCYTSGIVEVRSAVDNEKYQVVGEFEDSQKAADVLAKINCTILKFLRYLKTKYCIHSMTCNGGVDYPKHLRGIVRRILENYNPEVIIENDPRYSSDTSYTVDKGRKMYICIRNKRTLKILDTDLITFVVLHEIAHIGNRAWGHEENFWEIFKFILHEAKLAGIHNPVDYSKHATTYCGLDVNYNPYFDKKLVNIWELKYYDESQH